MFVLNEMRILLYLIIIGLAACNEHQNIEFPLLQSKPNADGSIRFFVNSVDPARREEITFTPCITTHSTNGISNKGTKSVEQNDLCPSEELGAKLIAKQTMEIQYYQLPANSVRCCFVGFGGRSCHMEEGPDCEHGHRY